MAGWGDRSLHAIIGGHVEAGAKRRTGALSILMVAENISARLSGETVLPCYYLQHLKALGQDVRAICHARVRDQLRADLDAETFARLHFVEDMPLQRLLFRMGRAFPYRVEDLVFNQLIQLLTQLRMRREVRRIVADHRIDIVFQPAPIAAKALSFLHNVGAPVVIGPMSGGMELPPAFRRMDGPLVRWAIRWARQGSALLHRIVPGKLRAAALIVANGRTERALPPGVRGRIHRLMESAVELEKWQLREPPRLEPGAPVSFIFCSRFVDWKGIAYLVRAFLPLARAGGVRLDLVGDGELYEAIKAQVEAEGIADRVVLHGRVPLDDYIALLREADVFVSPSLRECGGIAMMEAMAIGVPVIAADWGGAAQYAGPDCAILVDPASEQQFVDGLTDAMRRLARSPELRRTLGVAGRLHLEAMDLSWAAKTRQVLDILEETVAESRQAPAPDKAWKALPA